MCCALEKTELSSNLMQLKNSRLDKPFLKVSVCSRMQRFSVDASTKQICFLCAAYNGEILIFISTAGA